MSMDDFESRREAAFNAKRGRREHEQQTAGPIIQAAIAAKFVTGTPEWDRILTIIQAYVENAKQAKASMEDAIMAKNIVDPNAMMQIKIDALIAQERISVLEAIIALPSDIMKNAEAAKLNLEKFRNE